MKRKKHTPQVMGEHANVILTVQGRLSKDSAGGKRGDKGQEDLQLTVNPPEGRDEISLQELCYGCVSQFLDETKLDPNTISLIQFKWRTDDNDRHKTRNFDGSEGDIRPLVDPDTYEPDMSDPGVDLYSLPPEAFEELDRLPK